MTLRVYLSAGEPSGDLHGARVAAAIRALAPDAVLEGVGGPHMEAAGVRLTEGIRSRGAMGLVEAAAALPAHARSLRRARHRLETSGYHAAVLIDYPGFHLRLLRTAARRGVPVLYYIPPQLWAWGMGRAARLREARVTVAAILPFEEPFFESLGIPVRFVGHPLLDLARPSRAAARARLGLGPESRILALAPGSRPAEVRRLWPILGAAARQLRARLPDLHIVVAATGENVYPDCGDLVLHWDDTATVLAAADAALAKSGTVTLEAALADTPMVVVYAMHPLTFAIARRVVRTPRVALVNLVTGRDVAPEYLQARATADRLAAAVMPLLAGDREPARLQRAALAEVRARLGTPGAARRVAEMTLAAAHQRMSTAECPMSKS